MSRQGKVNKMVKAAMEGYDDDSSEGEKDLAPEEWEMVDSLIDMFALT
jgi:hypothetical protein